MKHFLFFCLIYSITLYADNPNKLNRAKRKINETTLRMKNALKK